MNVRFGSTLVVLAAAGLLAAPVAAQEHEGREMEHGEPMEMEMPEEGFRAEVIRDIEEVEEKYMALAEAMRDHYDWRPGEGVRSQGEVFNHVSAANFYFPTIYGFEPPEEMRGETAEETTQAIFRTTGELTDPDEIEEMLSHSFMHVRHTVARLPDDRLTDMASYFGEESTIRRLLHFMTGHLHEHLGQSIAYARTNGVVPPWSEGGS